METKHTPGPWRLVGKKRRNVTQFEHKQKAYIMAQGKSVFRIAIVDGPSNNDEFNEFVANARLIAAAPDLLEACKRLVDSCRCQNGCDPDDMTCDTMFAIKAIAKAEGES